MHPGTEADLDDRLSALDNHIDHTSIERPPPFEPVQAALPERKYHSFDEYVNVPAEHKAEHSNLYHLVMPTIDLSGIRHDGNMEVTAASMMDTAGMAGASLSGVASFLLPLKSPASLYDLQLKLVATNIQAMEL